VRRAILSRGAQRDLLDAARWIARDNPTAARALREAVAKAAQRIGVHPHIGSVRSALAEPPYRFLPLIGFPYVIVYDAEREPPLIIRVLHGARDLPDALVDL
jgi:toxin ParE1/3/4